MGGRPQAAPGTALSLLFPMSHIIQERPCWRPAVRAIRPCPPARRLPPTPSVGPLPYWSHLEKSNRNRQPTDLGASHPPSRLQPSVLIPPGPTLVDTGHRSSAPRIGDISPVAPSALPPVVQIQLAEHPAPRPGTLDLTA